MYGSVCVCVVARPLTIIIINWKLLYAYYANGNRGHKRMGERERDGQLIGGRVVVVVV